MFPRYSEFDDLRSKLVKTFPHAGDSLPPLPKKSFICTDCHPHPLHPSHPTCLNGLI
jgi:hypothetical protein